MTNIRTRPIGINISNEIIFKETPKEPVNVITDDIENMISSYIEEKYNAVITSSTIRYN